MFFRHSDPVAKRLIHLGIPAAAADRLSHGGTLLDLPAGATLCTKGERGTQAFLLVDGEASVLTEGGVVTLGPGEVVGEIATLDRRVARNATVVTATPASVLVFDIATFRMLAGTDELRPRLAPQRSAA